jgi:U3 small nucleolar RNA-associated protein 7
MVSTGQDLKMAVWDIRMYKEVNSYTTRQPATSVAISDRGLTAVGWGTTTTIWRGLFNKSVAKQEKVKSPYMQWGGEGKRIERVRWCPFEDILGVSHSSGFNNVIVPGAGEPNFDAMEVNPYETVKQRQNAEVKGLLEKIQPEMISLNPDFVGTLDLLSAEQRKAEQDLDKKPSAPEKIKHKMRGKSSSMQNNKRKQERKKLGRNIIDAKRVELEEARKERLDKMKGQVQETKESLGPALGRFVRK